MFAVGLQVFVRELISNASDALEKMRYLTLTGEIAEGPDARSLEIHIATDKHNRTLTIQVLFIWYFCASVGIVEPARVGLHNYITQILPLALV